MNSSKTIFLVVFLSFLVGLLGCSSSQPEPAPAPKPQPKPAQPQPPPAPTPLQQMAQQELAAIAAAPPPAEPVTPQPQPPPIVEEAPPPPEEPTAAAPTEENPVKEPKEEETPPATVLVVEAPSEEAPPTPVYELRTIYFDFDRSEIKAEFRHILTENYQWLRQHPDAKLLLEGHCDERGANEYNLALGERRAKAIYDYLLSLGAKAAQLSTVSFGEEKPAVEGHHEQAWSKNRRVEFTIQ